MAEWTWLPWALGVSLAAFLILRHRPDRAEQEARVLTALRRHPHDGLSASEVARIAYVHPGRTFEILWRLTDAGILVADWDATPDAPDRPPRRRYRLAEGARHG